MKRTSARWRAVVLALLALPLPVSAGASPEPPAAERHTPERPARKKQRRAAARPCPDRPEGADEGCPREVGKSGRRRRAPRKAAAPVAARAPAPESALPGPGPTPIPPSNEPPIAPAEEVIDPPPAIEEGAALDHAAAAFDLVASLSTRYTAVDLRPGVAGAAPGSSAALELVLQPKLELASDTLNVAGDLSLLAQTHGASPARLLLNEGWVEARFGRLRVLAGRRRLFWSSGIASNPADPLSPPKDLLDPERERSGTFLLPMLDLGLGPVTVTAAISPIASFGEAGLPADLDFRRGWLSGRVYWLVAETDLHLSWHRSLLDGRDRLGASASRVFFDRVELHAEAEAGGSMVAGARLDWPDSSTLIAEWVHRAEGLDAASFDALRAAGPELARAALGIGEPSPGEVSVVLPRRHYLLLALERRGFGPGLFDELTGSASLVAGLEDGSAILQARLRQRLGEAALVALSGAAWLGPAGGQFSMMPARAAVTLELRVTH